MSDDSWEANMLKVKEWSNNELLSAAKLLIAYANTSSLQKELYAPYIGRNTLSGNVYLADEDSGDSFLLATASERLSLPDIEIDRYIYTPDQGHEGTMDDLLDEFFDMSFDDQEFLINHSDFSEELFRPAFMQASLDEVVDNLEATKQAIGKVVDDSDLPQYLNNLLNWWVLLEDTSESWDFKEWVCELAETLPEYAEHAALLRKELEDHGAH